METRQTSQTPFVRLGERRWRPIPSADSVEQPLALDPPEVTRIDRFGLSDSDVRFFMVWIGDEFQVAELVTWVVRAHLRLERHAFPNRETVPSVGMLRDAHPQAVVGLEQLLNSLVDDPTLSVGQGRSILSRRIQGWVFPEALNKAGFEELLAIARTLNVWLAERGSFPCGCSALHVEERR